MNSWFLAPLYRHCDLRENNTQLQATFGSTVLLKHQNAVVVSLNCSLLSPPHPQTRRSQVLKMQKVSGGARELAFFISSQVLLLVVQAHHLESHRFENQGVCLWRRYQEREGRGEESGIRIRRTQSPIRHDGELGSGVTCGRDVSLVSILGVNQLFHLPYSCPGAAAPAGKPSLLCSLQKYQTVVLLLHPAGVSKVGDVPVSRGCRNQVHLPREQHGFKQRGSTFMQTFFS